MDINIIHNYINRIFFKWLDINFGSREVNRGLPNPRGADSFSALQNHTFPPLLPVHYTIIDWKKKYKNKPDNSNHNWGNAIPLTFPLAASSFDHIYLIIFHAQ